MTGWGFRLVYAPWWVRWLATSSYLVLVVLASTFTMSRPGASPNWRWDVVLVVVIGVAIGAALTAMQQPTARVFAATLDGLDGAARRRVGVAL
jgi:peptidoglycan/LPS O-acetylase OafA/YrhL